MPESLTLARRGLNALFAAFPLKEVEAIDHQPERDVLATDLKTGEVSVITTLPAGPWVCVDFVGGDKYAIWKSTGAVHRIGPDGAVEDDPILTV